MAAYENSSLCILFGFLLSILFCNDGHHEVLSKDFIYGCLVRNRKLDPSMGDNFKCFYLNARYHYRRKQFSRKFKVAIPISKTTGHRFITLAPPHIHYLVWIFLYAWMFIAILERLPGGNVPEKRNTFRGITFFPFSPKRREMFCTICLFNQCQASSWGKRWFVLNQAHSLSGLLQIVQL